MAAVFAIALLALFVILLAVAALSYVAGKRAVLLGGRWLALDLAPQNTPVLVDCGKEGVKLASYRTTGKALRGSSQAAEMYRYFGAEPGWTVLGSALPCKPRGWLPIPGRAS